MSACTRNAPIALSIPSSPDLSGAQSFLRTQDAYLQQVDGALNRMSALAAEARDAAKTDDERAALQEEFATLSGYITDIADKDFNRVRLFSGTLLIVANVGNDSTCKIPGLSLTLEPYIRATSACIATPANAAEALQAVKTAIAQLETDCASITTSEKQLQRVNDQFAVRDENRIAAMN